MSKLRSRTTSRLTKAGIAAGGITGILLATTAIPAFAAVPGTLSVSSGPSGGGNTVTLTTAAGSAPFTTASPVVEFQAVTAANAGCSTFYKAAANVTASTATPFTSTAGVVVAPAAGSPGGPTRLTTNKLVIPIPVGVSPTGVALVGSQTSSKFYICVYDSTSLTTSTLLSSATYAIAAQPTLLTATASGPALGGNTVTITGTGFNQRGDDGLDRRVAGDQRGGEHRGHHPDRDGAQPRSGRQSDHLGQHDRWHGDQRRDQRPGRCGGHHPGLHLRQRHHRVTEHLAEHHQPGARHHRGRLQQPDLGD